MTVFVTTCPDAYVRESDQVPDPLVGTVQYARTGDYDPDAPRKGSLNRAIHAIAIVGKASEPGEIYLVAPLSNHWPDMTHKVPSSRFMVGGTGEIHVGAPYKIHKNKIRFAHDGGQKTLKPGALERLQAEMQENGALLCKQQQGVESYHGYQSHRACRDFQHPRHSVRDQNTYGMMGRARL